MSLPKWIYLAWWKAEFKRSPYSLGMQKMQQCNMLPHYGRLFRCFCIILQIKKHSSMYHFQTLVVVLFYGIGTNEETGYLIVSGYRRPYIVTQVCYRLFSYSIIIIHHCHHQQPLLVHYRTYIQAYASPDLNFTHYYKRNNGRESYLN